MSIVPYLRPQIDGDLAESRALFVTGKFPLAKPRQEYSGEISIVNQIGACTVKQIAGDTLPAGHSIQCISDRIVITWPEYSEDAAPVINPGFEDMDKGWDLGPGWRVSSNNAISGLLSAEYADNTGESVVSSLARYPAPATPVNAKCLVRQGASSAGNAGAGVRLEYRDPDGKLISSTTGNMVMSASGNAVKQSTVVAVPPGPGVTVNIAAVGNRKRQNRPLWVDDFSWDLKIPASGVAVNTVFNITLQVTDSAGRVAIWSGDITVADAVWDGSWTRSKNIPGFTTNCVAYSPVHDRFVAMGYISAAYIAAAVYTSGVDVDWTATPTPPNPLTAARSVIWADELGIFIACGLNDGGAWSADGTSWAATSGPNQGIIPCWGSGFGYQVGGAGSAQVKQSTNGKNWSWSGVTLPSGGNMGTCVSIAYSPTLNKFVTVGYTGRGAMHNTSYTAWDWCTFDGVLGAFGGGAFAEVLWNAKDEHFYAFMGISNPTVYRSADGVNFTTLKTLPIAPIQCAAFSPAFGYVVVTAADLYRYDDNFELIETRASPSLGQSFTLRWEASLGKFILTYAQGFALSNSVA